MPIKKPLVAVFTISPVVPQFILDMRALMNALTTAPGNTYVTLAPAVVTSVNGHLDTLTTDEAKAATRAEGTAATRDVSLVAVVNDAYLLKAEVQLAANAAPDEETARQIIEGCGMRVKERTANPKPDFDVRNVNNTQGMLEFISKAAPTGTRAAYLFQTSVNGITFTTATVSLASRAKWASGAAAGTKLYCRKQVFTNKDSGTPPFSQVVILLVV